MSFEERDAARKLYQKTIEKTPHKKLKYTQFEQCLFITGLE